LILIIYNFLTFDEYTSNDNVNGINKAYPNIIITAFTVPNTTVFFEDNNASINHVTINNTLNSFTTSDSIDNRNNYNDSIFHMNNSSI
jgi:hypothetical protein